MKNIIQEQIDKISQECSSIYSKEDVIKILTVIGNSKETQTNSALLDLVLKEVYNVFKERIESEDWSNVVDPYSAEFRIDGCTEVVLDHINIHEKHLCELVQYSIDQAQAIKSAV